MEEFRGNANFFFQRNLGIQNKPGIPRERVSRHRNEQIRLACHKLVNGCHSLVLGEIDVEAVLTLFCEREECDFSESHMSILEMLVPLRCSLDELYNMFYAINTKFIPRFVFPLKDVFAC